MMRRSGLKLIAAGASLGNEAPKFHPRPSIATGLHILRKPIQTPEDVVGVVINSEHGNHPVAKETGFDPISSVFTLVAWGLFAYTYIIIFNWIYEGYCDFWDGTYGLDDDDEDD